eukprot:TRINITY_DN830_c0_g2_i1.p3 TRINITY_DN830_c0_g2~~TRINITY_DN830_c0_g2_i1.p3  ORF type:complete len:133 (+),score=24.62 TRINITY_DN830_c0_g2_i1:757-1155(+)
MTTLQPLSLRKVGAIPEVLCEGFPRQVAAVLKYCRELRFEEMPKYEHVEKLLGEIAKENRFSLDNVFDLSLRPHEEELKEERVEDISMKVNLSHGNMETDTKKLTLKFLESRTDSLLMSRASSLVTPKSEKN